MKEREKETLRSVKISTQYKNEGSGVCVLGIYWGIGSAVQGRKMRTERDERKMLPREKRRERMGRWKRMMMMLMRRSEKEGERKKNEKS